MSHLRPPDTIDIGDVASRLGVSVRALRLYETAGLIAPRRSQSGRRVFGTFDIVRLQQILVLKGAGCTLAQITQLLRQHTLSPDELIERQIAMLDAQHARLGEALRRLRAARARLAGGEHVTVSQLCDLISMESRTMTDAWKQVFDRYYTPEEQARWEVAKSGVSDADAQAASTVWGALIARVEAAIADGAAVDSERAIGLAREWLDLQRPLMDALGAKTWNKAADMYRDMDSWQTSDLRAPFSKQVYTFICAAAEAGRARGVIAPRAEGTTRPAQS